MGHNSDLNEKNDLGTGNRVSAEYLLRHFLKRLLILLAGTVLVSAVYKCMIEIGIFKIIKGTEQRRLFYCAFELLLLGGFWHCLFIFSKKCRHRSRTRRAYYLIAFAVAGAYSGICCVLYYFLTRDTYSWFFRITLCLCGVRFRTSFPENLAVYLLAYLIITLLIMLLEPTVAEKRYQRFNRKMKGIPGPLEVRIQAFFDSVYEKRYRREKKRRQKKKQKAEQKENEKQQLYQKTRE